MSTHSAQYQLFLNASHSYTVPHLYNYNYEYSFNFPLDCPFDFDPEKELPYYLLKINSVHVLCTRTYTKTDVYESYAIPIDTPQDPVIPASTNKIFVTNHQVTQQPLCLLIKDVQNIDYLELLKVSSLFGRKFHNIMIYGRVIPGYVRHIENQRYYEIDDGTGRITFIFRHGAKTIYGELIKACFVITSLTVTLLDSIRTYNNIKTMVDTSKKVGIRTPDGRVVPKNSTELERILTDMQILCKSIAHNLNNSEYLELGKKCFVYGKPFRRKDGVVQIYANEVLRDYSVDRDKEIRWKCMLSKLYKTYSKQI
jgi:hypothetical protein